MSLFSFSHCAGTYNDFGDNPRRASVFCERTAAARVSGCSGGGFIAWLDHVARSPKLTQIQAGRAQDLRQDFSGRAADSRQYYVWQRHTYPAALLLDVQNESIWQLKPETAGARGGAREGRPRHPGFFLSHRVDELRQEFSVGRRNVRIEERQERKRVSSTPAT